MKYGHLDQVARNYRMVLHLLLLSNMVKVKSTLIFID